MSEDLGNEPEQYAGKEKQLANELKEISADAAKAYEIPEEYDNLNFAANVVVGLASDAKQSDNDRNALYRASEIIGLKIEKLNEIRGDKVQQIAEKSSQVADQRELNTLRAESHFNKNEEAYKQQAVNDAAEAGKDVNYPGYEPEKLNPEYYGHQQAQLQSEYRAIQDDPNLDRGQKDAKLMQLRERAEVLQKRSPSPEDFVGAEPENNTDLLAPPPPPTPPQEPQQEKNVYTEAWLNGKANFHLQDWKLRNKESTQEEQDAKLAEIREAIRDPYRLSEIVDQRTLPPPLPPKEPKFHSRQEYVDHANSLEIINDSTLTPEEKASILAEQKRILSLDPRWKSPSPEDIVGRQVLNDVRAMKDKPE